ncbi:hypothetical protein [Candidatus Enterovibrio escicola]
MAKRSKGTIRRFYGVKLHLIINDLRRYHFSKDNSSQC